MKIETIKRQVDDKLYTKLKKEIQEFRPAQEKAIKAGLIDGKSLLVCTPTASGKTLVAEIAAMNSIYKRIGKAVYIVPLKALAQEKYKDFSSRYKDVKTTVSVGDLDEPSERLGNNDLIITTSEKLDSLIRHHTHWLKDVSVVIIDEIHLLNDPGRGPTLEILITILRQLLSDCQIIALSATIGNPKELSEWLGAELVVDSWRPVELKKGIGFSDEVEFY